MGLKVYIMQKKELKDISILPLYVSIFEKENFGTLICSSLSIGEPMKMSITDSSLINTSTERALIVPASEECLDAFLKWIQVELLSPTHITTSTVIQIYL